MSLATRIESLVIRVAQEFNDVRATAGNLASLTTTDKSSLVAAINELKAAVLSATAIDDNQIATTTTYSSNKIVSLLDALKADILGGADAAYDTLVEIQQLLQNGTTGLDALLAAVNLRVRFDAAQTLTVAEQLQARTNIGAVAAADVGNTDTDFVVIFDGRWPDEPRVRIAALAARIGFEVKPRSTPRIPASPGWVSFGYVGGQVVIASAHNVASVVRTAAGRYRVHFAVAMPDANYCWTALAQQHQQRPTCAIVDPAPT